MASKEDDESGTKKKGAVQVPEFWPWQEAKKLFEKPDVLPADQVEVGEVYCLSQTFKLMQNYSSSGKRRMLKVL